METKKIMTMKTENSGEGSRFAKPDLSKRKDTRQSDKNDSKSSNNPTPPCPNLGLNYYKGNGGQVINKGDTRLGYRQESPTNHMENYQMITQYPGLICGIGYQLCYTNEEDFQLGFSFDYTTGLPMIPGSSVKGLLRSFFKDGAYICKIIENTLGVPTENDSAGKVTPWKEIDYHKLERAVFDGIDYQTQTKLGKYHRDVFGDVFIAGFNNDMLRDDFITPHHKGIDEVLDLLQDPVPHRFLKIKAGVVLDFSFRLVDTEVASGLTFTKKMKWEVFSTLFEEFGIGAKTNVGYGRLKPLKKTVKKSEPMNQ
jgi:CRISPR-associated protein Cmr6